ncbi:hypothetical protein [Streptomyces sp. NPDC048521]|uniref:hypothetical protein n=1 Tax=Streptomyces sp. NPDC048521 TaxID=3365566 RepID=UPI0037192506
MADGFSVAQSISQASRQAGSTDPDVRRAEVQSGIVTAVGITAGTVDVGSIRARRLDTYQQPAVGDQVLLVQSGSGNWWAAGRVATAAWPIGTTRYAYKPSDTNRASTTTFTDDPDLTMPLDANAVFRVKFELNYTAIDQVSGSAAGRFKTAWTTPAGATGVRSAVGADQGTVLSSTSSGGQGRWGVHNFTTAATYGDRDSTVNQVFAMESGTVFTTSAGTVALQWAQAVANASATRLAAGSFMRVTRLA